MPSIIIGKLLDRIGHPELLQALTRKLSGTELNSLLLEVFRNKSKTISAPRLLRNYQLNQYVKPADLPVLDLKETELNILKLFKNASFEPIELSPVTILGSCSVVAPADQNKILTALRGTEVLADSTNAMALHICDLKKQRVWQETASDRLQFGAIQRHIRTQPLLGKGFTSHFKVGCLVTAGTDSGNFTFEKQSIFEHISLMKSIFETFYKVDSLSFRLICRDGYADSFRLASEVKVYVSSNAPGIELEIIKNPGNEINYYKGIQYKVDIRWKDKVFEIGDGGFVDWTQQILQNKKERLLISGFGFDLMYRIVNGMI